MFIGKVVNESVDKFREEIHIK